jgi:zinc protease
MTSSGHRLSCLVVFLTLSLCGFSARATTVEEVTSVSGIRAWLVEDHHLPLIALQFAFKGGVEQDPVAKQGLATLTMSLLTQGAGDYDSAAFQQQLADHSVMMNFEAARDTLGGSMKILREERAAGFDLLHLALAKPRFDASDIARARARQLTEMRFGLGDPEWQARYALLNHIFAGHPYSERRFGTAKTLAGLTVDDIRAFAVQHFARDNLVVAVAGDITPEELKAALDQIFGDLPAKAALAPIPEVVWPKDTPVILVPREGTQTELLFAMPGPQRLDPDWYAADIANYILGGGGFSSRLMNEVRDKNGLTYGIGTDLAPMDRAAMIAGDAATDNDKTGKAWQIALDTMRGFYANGATAEEITAAKDYLTGSLPLMLTSTDAIAGVLLDMQLHGLGRDYLDRRDQLIRGVTVEDVMRVVKRWFDPKLLTLVMVGKPQGIVPTVTEAPVGE